MVAGQAQGQVSYPKGQIDQAERLNDKCRGGSGDDPNTQKACDQRDTAYNKLAKDGWCYGKPGDAGYQRTWQRCVPSSIAKSTRKAPDFLTGYVFSRNGRSVAPGETVSRGDVIYALYSNVPCSLPIAAAPTMQAAEMIQGSQLSRACWAPTLSPLSDEFTIVSQYGHIENGSLLNFVGAQFRGDGTVTSTGPAITQSEYQKRIQDYHRSLR